MIKIISQTFLSFLLVSCSNGGNEKKETQATIDSLRERIAVAKFSLNEREVAIKNFSTLSDSIKKENGYDSIVNIQQEQNKELAEMEGSLKKLEAQLLNK